MVKIILKNVSKTFQKKRILKDINLEVKDKEYFILLGPTGAGKTTILKLISGVLKPDEGSVLFDDEVVNNVPPSERNLGMVFENYALFPHMSVLENLCYSGRVHDRDPNEVKKLASQILYMTLLTGRDNAKPNELSGGMQQRVALSRALMNLEQTGLLLLDEPLKALDAGLRMNLRREIWKMAKSKYLQLTVVHVTNEMEEAMMVADRIALVNNGRIEQVGNPFELYYKPKNLFVANFMSEINLFEGKAIKNAKNGWNIDELSKTNESLYQQIAKDARPIQIKLNHSNYFAGYCLSETHESIKDGDELLLVVRANHLKIRLGNRLQDKRNSFYGVISRRKFMGVFYRFEVACQLDTETKTIIVSVPATAEIHQNYLEGSDVTIYFPKELGIVLKHPGKDEIDSVMVLK